MQEIPPAKSSDAEDVVWGLQTADTLWRRGERIDAIVWLRRAAQAAGAANDDDRAVELARCAAELSDWMATLPPGKMSEAPAPGSTPPLAPHFPNQDAITTFVPGMEVTSHEVDTSALRGPTGTERPEVPFAPPASSPTLETAMPSFEQPSIGRDDAPSVLPAEHVHAGMFNPWADNPERPSLPQPPPAPPSPRPPTKAPTAKVAPPSVSHEDDGVITSVKPAPISSVKAPPMPPPPKVPGKPPPLPPRARAQASQQPPPVAPSPPHSEPTSVEVEIEEAISIPPDAPSGDELAAVPVIPPFPSSLAEEPTSTTPAATPPMLDLNEVEAFADLPDDARDAFAAAAQVHDLAEGEEVSHFALAYVLIGEMDVAATMVDAPALRLLQGDVLRSRGTTNEGVPMRLICATSEGRVATWSTRDVEEAFRAIPWVEEDLRTASDRAMTLVGITIGPLGERLDVSIREAIVGKLTMKPLEPHEVVVNVGEAVPGLFLVGVGELELVRDDTVVGKVGSGDFLFATEVLGAGPAPASARAGAGGALILFGDLRVAQELLVTCPPLLEVFAGM